MHGRVTRREETRAATVRAVLLEPMVMRELDVAGKRGEMAGPINR